MAFQSLLRVSLLCLFLQCQGVPMADFFPTEGFTGSDEQLATVDLLTTACGDVNRLRVMVNGGASLQMNDNQRITFTPFLVDSSMINNPSSTFELQSEILSASASNIDTDTVDQLEMLYNDYYPRRARDTPLDISRSMIVTWTLETGSGPNLMTDVFQVVAGFNSTQNAAFILYQYADGMMQWSSASSMVSMDICGSTRTYEPPENNSSLHDNIVNDSNTNVPGRYAFLYTGSDILPAVICRVGCDLDNGYCVKRDTCLCTHGWTGDNCTEFDCHPECLVNGACQDAAFVCVCDPGWTGGNCTIPICNDCSENGECISPDVCQCAPGWTGESCETPICNAICSNNVAECVEPGVYNCDSSWTGDGCCDPVCSPSCVNGDCESPNNCACNPGWLGAACNEANCTDDCLTNGFCDQPLVCTCNAGWTGDSCDQPICLEGCDPQFGSCEMPGECNCDEGYIGDLCDSTPATPVLDQTEIGLLAGGLIVFVIITAIVIAAVILSIRLC